MWAVFAIIGIALLLLAVAMAVPRVRRAWLWESARAEVVGLEKTWRERTVGKLIECRRVYHPRLRFRDATGTEREIVLDAGDATWCPCEDPTGSAMPIRYNPADPSQAVVWEPWAVWLPAAAPLLGAIASVVIACCAW